MSEHNNNGKFMFGFFLGGLLGALLIFFLGTKEGKKASKEIEQKGKDVLDDLEGKIDEMEKKGKELVRHGEELKDHVVETLEEKKEVLGKEATERLETALANIESIQERGMETTANLRKRFFKNTPKKS